MRLAVGDIVVYRSHGAGPVTARENKVLLGSRREVIELELIGGLRVELPLDRAHELLRPLASESDLECVQEALRADQTVSSGSWLKRKKESLAKLSEGDPVGLAEIICDGTRRDAARTSNSAAPTRSSWERELAKRARRLLSIEIAFAREIEPEEADTWIDLQLGRHQ